MCCHDFLHMSKLIYLFFESSVLKRAHCIQYKNKHIYNSIYIYTQCFVTYIPCFCDNNENLLSGLKALSGHRSKKHSIKNFQKFK